jgi:hypothetical protein
MGESIKNINSEDMNLEDNTKEGGLICNDSETRKVDVDVVCRRTPLTFVDSVAG